MVSRLSMVSSPEDSTVIERAEAVVVAVADHLTLPPPVLTPAVLGCQLDDLVGRLEQRIALGPGPAEDSVATAELLTSVLKLRNDLIDHDVARRVTSLSEIRNALEELRGLSPREMIHAAPVVLSRKLGFTRTMISAVRGSLWLPQRLHIENELSHPESRRFRKYVDGAHFQLAVAPLETEVVRQRCGVLVPSPTEDERTFKELVEVSGCFGYVAAPITFRDSAIGLLHADRPPPEGMVTMDHLDQLEIFAECLSVAFESAVLEEKANLQRIEVENLCVNVDGLRSRAAGSALWSAPGATPRQRHDRWYRRGQPVEPALTAREREIMAHVATGATNSQIARSLMISEGTVKSHLKRIAKKLNTPSRAAAVAVYSGMAGAGAGGAR